MKIKTERDSQTDLEFERIESDLLVLSNDKSLMRKGG